MVSNPVVLATYNTLGARRKFYYRFQNVQLERDSVTVFYPPGAQAVQQSACLCLLDACACSAPLYAAAQPQLQRFIPSL